MNTFNENEFLITTGEYKTDFWNAMREKRKATEKILSKQSAATKDYPLPYDNDKQLQNAIKRESKFRNLATVVTAYNGDYTIFGKDCDDLAAWVPEGGEIPIYDGVNEMTILSMMPHSGLRIILHGVLPETLQKARITDLSPVTAFRLLPGLLFPE